MKMHTQQHLNPDLAMKITHDATVDAWYIQLVPKIKKGEAIKQKRVKNSDEQMWVLLDYDKKGRLLGIEIMEVPF